jgi:hypothetical protein
MTVPAVGPRASGTPAHDTTEQPQFPPHVLEAPARAHYVLSLRPDVFNACGYLHYRLAAMHGPGARATLSDLLRPGLIVASPRSPAPVDASKAPGRQTGDPR